MPTTAGIVLLGLLVVLAVVGVVLWAWQSQQRRAERPRPAGREAPFEAESAASRDAYRGQAGSGGGV